MSYFCFVVLACPPFEKKCPECGNTVHVRKLNCSCGYRFSGKPKRCLTSKGALETDHESEKRRLADASRHAHERALENHEKSKQRKMADQVTTANKRHRKRSDVVSLQYVIDSFIAKTKQGPDYVCTSCHRLMYKQNVVPVNVHKYSKATPALLADVLGTECLYTNFDGYQWICYPCASEQGNVIGSVRIYICVCTKKNCN